MATLKREGDKLYTLIADRMRYAGEITQLGDKTVLSTSRNRADDLGEISGCYKFHKEVINHSEWFTHILLHESSEDGLASYLIPREDIIKWNAIENDTHYCVSLGVIKEYHIFQKGSIIAKQ